MMHVRRRRGKRNQEAIVFCLRNSNRNVARKVRNVRNDPDHFFTRVCRRRAVHAVQETLRNAILKSDNTVRPLIPLGKTPVDSNEAATAFYRAGANVTRRTRHAHVDVVRQMGVCIDDNIVSEPYRIAEAAGRQTLRIVQ